MQFSAALHSQVTSLELLSWFIPNNVYLQHAVSSLSIELWCTGAVLPLRRLVSLDKATLGGHRISVEVC